MTVSSVVFVITTITIGGFVHNVLSSILSDNNHYHTENLLTKNINCTKTTSESAKVESVITEFTAHPTYTASRTGSSPDTTIVTIIPSSTLPIISNNTRIRRNVSPFEEDEIGWTNINEEADMALKTIWPYFIEHGYTTLALPDLADSISVKPLIITYSAGLRLTNGHLYNIEGIVRHGDAYMTYVDKSFQFRLNLIISSQQFVYDFLVGILGIEAGGTVNGFLQQTLVSGDFSIRATDANVKLNNFQILSFGNIEVSLTHNTIIRQLSSMILTPITNYFKDRITTTISDGIRVQLENLMDDINNNDTLELKKFLNQTLSGLVG